MAELPPLITSIEDRMAWAAYTSHCAMSGIEEPMVPDYRQFKVERMVWDAVARGVVDAAAQFINEIKEKAARYDQMAGTVAEPSARDILHEIKMEGLRNHNTRCRPWWHKVVDFFAKEGKT